MKHFSLSGAPSGAGRQELSKNTDPRRYALFVPPDPALSEKPAAPDGASDDWELFVFPGLTPPGYFLPPYGLEATEGWDLESLSDYHSSTITRTWYCPFFSPS